MPITIQYAPPASLVGRVAYQAGRGRFLQEERQRAQQAAEFAAQMDFRQRAAAQEAWQREQELAANAVLKAQNLQERWAEKQLDAGQRAALAAATLSQKQEWADAREAKWDADREQAHDKMVAQGLKDGTLYFSPTQRQALNRNAEELSALEASDLPEPEKAPRRVELLRKRQQHWRNPMVRGPDEMPKSLAEQMEGAQAPVYANGTMTPSTPGERPIGLFFDNGAGKREFRPFPKEDAGKDTAAQGKAEFDARMKQYTAQVAAVQKQNAVVEKQRADYIKNQMEANANRTTPKPYEELVIEAETHFPRVPYPDVPKLPQMPTAQPAVPAQPTTPAWRPATPEGPTRRPSTVASPVEKAKVDYPDAVVVPDEVRVDKKTFQAWIAQQRKAGKTRFIDPRTGEVVQ